MELNSTDRKALEKKKELLETRYLGIIDALGAKSAIILVDNDGKVLCKSSLAAPGFHLLMETSSVQNSIATHITECTSSNLLTTVMVSSLRSKASKKTILAQLVKDLQFRSGRMLGPYIPRSTSNESRAMEVSRMSIPQLIEMLKRYASEGYKPHRSVREWLEDHESLSPRSDTNPEKFCTGATMKYLKPSTRKADDGRTSGNASEAKREGWRQQGALNLNNNKKSGDNSQQQHDDEDVINGSDDDDQINDSDEDRQINVGDVADVEQASVGDGGEKEEDEEKEKETEQFISSSVEEEDNNSTGSSIQLFVPNKNGTQKRKAPKTKVTIAGGKMSNNNKTAAGSAAATAASMRSTTTTAAKRKTPNNAGVTAAVAASSATTSSTSSTKRNKEKPHRYRN